jgi:hypothetical protein
MEMKKLIALLIIAAIAVAATARPLLLNLNEYGTTASLTNAASGYYEIDSIHIKYAAAATNTMAFSLITGGQEFAVASSASTNAAAATVAVTLDNKLPVYNGDVLKITTTATNAYVLVITKDDLK